MSAKLDSLPKEERESEGMRKVISFFLHSTPRTDTGFKLFFRQDGKLLKIPGIPPLYDYELSPQIVCDFTAMM